MKSRMFDAQTCYFGVLMATFLTAKHAQPVRANDWPQFRGENASAVALNSNPPIEFSGETGKNIAWHIELPGRGVGGPIIIGDQVITTSSSGLEQRRVYVTSVSAKSGEILWEQGFVARGRPYCHPTSANAAPTPASDGKRVFAFFSSNDLFCLDLSGNLVWYRSLATDFPKAGNDVGMSSSPAVADGVVVVQIECQGDSFVAGLDVETGSIRWRKDRPKLANWSSPLAVELPNSGSIAVVQCGEQLDAFEIRSGNQVWSLNMSCSIIPSTSTAGGKLFVPAGGITQVELASDGQPPSVGWNNNKLGSSSSSPVIFGDSIIAVNRSVLVRGDVVTGEVRSQLRLPDAGSIWSTPVVAGNHLYLFSETGRCFVVRLDDREETIVGTNELGQNVYGSPAVSGDAIYVRSATGLWKIERT